MTQTFNPSTQKQKQENLSEFELSLVYIQSSKPTKVKPCLKERNISIRKIRESRVRDCNFRKEPDQVLVDQLRTGTRWRLGTEMRISVMGDFKQTEQSEKSPEMGVCLSCPKNSK